MIKIVEITDRLGAVHLINLSSVAYILRTRPEPNPQITIFFAFATTSTAIQGAEGELTAHRIEMDIDYHDFKRQLKEQSVL